MNAVDIIDTITQYKRVSQEYEETLINKIKAFLDVPQITVFLYDNALIIDIPQEYIDKNVKEKIGELFVKTNFIMPLKHLKFTKDEITNLHKERRKIYGK